MIKLAGRIAKSGRLMITFGLEEANIERLQKGLPIHVHCDELGAKGLEIVICAGKDLEHLRKMFQPMINEHTEVIDKTKKETH
jgi:formylmethanofuran dehydrogenase subunit A